MPAAVLHMSSVVNSSPECLDNWVLGFAIPWDKCSNSLIQTIDVGKPPKETQLRELVAKVMSAV